jgi:hypothetical protein
VTGTKRTEKSGKIGNRSRTKKRVKTNEFGSATTASALLSASVTVEGQRTTGMLVLTISGPGGVVVASVSVAVVPTDGHEPREVHFKDIELSDALLWWPHTHGNNLNHHINHPSLIYNF